MYKIPGFYLVLMALVLLFGALYGVLTAPITSAIFAMSILATVIGIGLGSLGIMLMNRRS